MMRTEVRLARELIGREAEEERTRRKVAVGYLAVVRMTVCKTVERNEGGEAWIFEPVGKAIEAEKTLVLKRMLGLALAVTNKELKVTNVRLRTGCIIRRICSYT